MSRNSKAHSHSGLHAPDTRPLPKVKVVHATQPKPTKPKKVTAPLHTGTKAQEATAAESRLFAPSADLLEDKAVLNRIRMASLESLGMATKRLGQAMPGLGMLISELEGTDLLEVHALLDLLSSYIDAELKFAKGIFKVDDHHRLVRAMRRRLKQQAAP